MTAPIGATAHEAAAALGCTLEGEGHRRTIVRADGTVAVRDVSSWLAWLWIHQQEGDVPGHYSADDIAALAEAVRRTEAYEAREREHNAEEC